MHMCICICGVHTCEWMCVRVCAWAGEDLKVILGIMLHFFSLPLFNDVGSLTQTQNFLIWLPSGDSLHSEDGVNRPGYHDYLIFT